MRETIAIYPPLGTKGEVTYLHKEAFTTPNELAIWDIYEFYVDTMNSPHNTTSQIEYCNNIRNEAAKLLNSRKEGEARTAEQIAFLRNYFEFYETNGVKYPTNFDTFLQGVYIIVGNTLCLYHKDSDLQFASIEMQASARRITQAFKNIHECILWGVFYAKGKFTN